MKHRPKPQRQQMGYAAVLKELEEYVGPRDKGAIKAAARTLNISPPELANILRGAATMPDHIALKLGFLVCTYYQNQHPHAES